jgi:hypothetical protein
MVLKKGLCATCVNIGDCMYVKTRTRPVHQCETFDSYIPPVRLRRANPTVAVVESHSMRAAKPNGRPGLCGTCDNWETCTLTCPDGGVWHCEEYY